MRIFALILLFSIVFTSKIHSNTEYELGMQEVRKDYNVGNYTLALEKSLALYKMARNENNATKSLQIDLFIVDILRASAFQPDAMYRLNEFTKKYDKDLLKEYEVEILKMKSSVLFELKQYADALRIAMEALQNVRTKSDSAYLGELYNLIGTLSIEINEFDRAETYLYRAIDYNKLYDKFNLPLVQNNLARLYILKGEYKKAFNLAELAYKHSLETNTTVYLILSLVNLQRITYALKLYKESMDYNIELTELQQKVFNTAMHKSITEIQYRLKKEDEEEIKKMYEARIEKEKELLETQQYVNLILFYGGILGFIVTIVIFFQFKKARRNSLIFEQKNAEIDSINNKLIELNKSKDVLFSIISHDFRSPLISLISGIELFKNEQLSEAQKEELVNYIHENAYTTLSFVDNMIIWAKSQMGGIVVKKLHFEPRKIINQILQEIKMVYSSKKIKIEKVLPEDIKIFADPVLYEIVVRNLISNAIKFSNLGGVIQISLVEDDKKWITNITDNGVGMSAKLIEKIFSDTEFLTTPGTKGEKGNGLGLKLVQDFVKKNGGELSIQSKVNKGTTFSVSIAKTE